MKKISERTLKSFDGTSIAYQVFGGGKKTVVLCNGLGGTVVAWRPLFEGLWKHYRFICWDYRGLFNSGLPKDRSRLTIPDNVRDLQAILKKEKIKKAAIFGWSMGVQVALELYAHAPSIFKCMVLINGTYGNPFHTALNNPLSRYVLPKLNSLAQKWAPTLFPTLKPLAYRVVDWKGFVGLVASMGLVHKNLDHQIFKEVALAMLSTDLEAYHQVMHHLNEHSAIDVLPHIKTPTLIVSGESDKMTPLSMSRKMNKLIPHSQLFIVPMGSHYCMLEFPELVLLRVEKFLEEVGY